MTGNIRKNDAAANRTAYYERQSTYSPDLPLRYVMYVADLYSQMTRDNNLYSRKKVMIPSPGFVICQNYGAG